MRERLVVIGGDAAGMSAASQARRRRGPDDLDIVAVERGSYTSYSACGIPYYVGGAVDRLDELIARSPETFERNHAIRVLTGHEAAEIDLDRRGVRVRGPGGSPRWEGFDHLVVATGAVPAAPAIPGADADGVYGVQTLDHGVTLRHLVDRMADRTSGGKPPGQAVVVGGGYIGLEMAEALVRRGFRVSLVEGAPQPMGTLDADMGALVADALRGAGVDVYVGEPVTAFETAAGRVTAVVTRQRTLPADLVVLGLGVRPASDLARAAGIPVGESTGGIEVDRRMRTRVPGVWAAGDCVESFHLVSRRRVVVALGTHANKQGRVAGINIGGGYVTFPGVVGTAASKICGVEVARTGLSADEATAAGFAHVSAVVESTTRAAYYPGAAAMTIKVVAERGTGRLLGAQIVGAEGAAKRIDVLAVAVWNGMAVDELTGLDLAYAPPFAPVWDPVLIAARKADGALREDCGR